MESLILGKGINMGPDEKAQLKEVLEGLDHFPEWFEAMQNDVSVLKEGLELHYSLLSQLSLSPNITQSLESAHKTTMQMNTIEQIQKTSDLFKQLLQLLKYCLREFIE